jgi:hypothetical protein
MNEIMAVGVDLAKNVPQVLGVDTEGIVSVHRQLNTLNPTHRVYPLSSQGARD